MNQLQLSAPKFSLRTNPVSGWRGLSCSPGLEVISGPMFSGKTSVLIARLREAEELGLKVRCIHPNLSVSRPDVSSSAISTRFNFVGQQVVYPSYGVDSLDFKTSWFEEVEVLGIDDAHLLPELAGIVDNWSLKKRVIVCGLVLDFDRKPFPQMCFATALADYKLDLTATCGSCLKNLKYIYSKTAVGSHLHSGIARATASTRVVPLNVSAEAVGDDDHYRAICRTCQAQEDPTVFNPDLTARSSVWRGGEGKSCRLRSLTGAEDRLMFSPLGSSLIIPKS